MQDVRVCGIPCRHFVKLFLHYDIDNLPEHFVLRRWTKRANSYRVKDKVGLLSSTEDSKFHRLTHGTYLATQIVNDAAATKEGFELMVEAFTSLSEKLSSLHTAQALAMPPSKNSTIVSEEVDPSMVTSTNASKPQVILDDPNISQCKGRTKDSERLKRPIEEMKSNKQKTRKCGICGERLGHNAATCPKRQKV